MRDTQRCDTLANRRKRRGREKSHARARRALSLSLSLRALAFPEKEGFVFPLAAAAAAAMSKPQVKGGLFSALQGAVSPPSVRRSVSGACSNAAAKSQPHYMGGNSNGGGGGSGAGGGGGMAGSPMAASSSMRYEMESRLDAAGRNTPGRAAAGAEILNIINHVNDDGRDVRDFICCSPPTRASNPLCQDREFGKFFSRDSRLGAFADRGRDVSAGGGGTGVVGNACSGTDFFGSNNIGNNMSV